MRKALVGAIIGALWLGALAAPVQAGKKPKKRKAEMAYSEPAYGTAGVGVCLQGASCAFFGPPLAQERFVSVSIEDDLGTDVFASVIQDTNEDGNFLAADDLTVNFCGETAEPVELEPGKAVSVWVWQGPGADPPCAGPASAGMVTAIFSRTS
jgi:hypothetical protein